jgi:hypothetical protein
LLLENSIPSLLSWVEHRVERVVGLPELGRGPIVVFAERGELRPDRCIIAWRRGLRPSQAPQVLHDAMALTLVSPTRGKDGARNKDYRWRCKGCKQMFTVRTGTIFEETRLQLRVWVHACWRACASKKGISALQLAREMQITHNSALFVLRRIRHGLGEETAAAPKLTGTVEVDETYVGGKPRYANRGKDGRGTKKVPVVAMVQRGGNVRFRMMERLTSERND